MTTIMIVDDEPEMVNLIEDILSPKGYEIVRAYDGVEALRKLEETIPDLILLDIMMPDMDGIELCKRIKANPDLAETTVIMVTGKRDLDSQMDAIYTEADGYIFKPFGIRDLEEEVADFLEGKIENSLMKMKNRKKLLGDGE